jgi:hypothetical protein
VRQRLSLILTTVTILLAAGLVPGQDAPTKEQKPTPNGQNPEPKKELMLTEGPLQNLSGSISKVLKLKWKGGRLDLDDEHWEKARKGKTREEFAEEIARKLMARGIPKEFARKQAERRAEGSGLDLVFGQLRKDIGAHGAYERVAAGRKRRSFSGQSLSAGYLLVGFDRTITFIEELSPERVMIVKDRVDGMLSVSVIEPTGKSVLILRQDSQGRANVLHIDGQTVRRLEGETFLDIYRENRSYVDQTLLPILKEVGVLPPMGLDDPALARNAISRLRHLRDDDLEKKANELIRQLDSPEYIERESAHKEIAGNYLRYRDQVQAALKSPKTSREARMRLEKVVSDHPTQDNHGAILSGMKLLEEPAYLVSLLKIAEDDEDRAAVVARLKKLTGEDFGSDVDKWRGWLKQKEAKQPAESTP